MDDIIMLKKWGQFLIVNFAAGLVFSINLAYFGNNYIAFILGTIIAPPIIHFIFAKDITSNSKQTVVCVLLYFLTLTISYLPSLAYPIRQLDWSIALLYWHIIGGIIIIIYTSIRKHYPSLFDQISLQLSKLNLSGSTGKDEVNLTNMERVTNEKPTTHSNLNDSNIETKSSIKRDKQKEDGEKDRKSHMPSSYKKAALIALGCILLIIVLMQFHTQSNDKRCRELRELASEYSVLIEHNDKMAEKSEETGKSLWNSSGNVGQALEGIMATGAKRTHHNLEANKYRRKLKNVKKEMRELGCN